MRPGEPATKEELKAIRQQLIREIDEAQLLFGIESNRSELLTSKAALKTIEQLIRRSRIPKQASRNIA